MAEPCTLNMVMIMIIIMTMMVIMMGAHHMIMMTMNMIMMTMVKMMLMMISSLTQERREDILSRLTPTTCNIVKQSSHHNLNIMHQVDIFDKHAQNMQLIHYIVKGDTQHLRHHQAIQKSSKLKEPTEIIHNIKLSSHYNFKIKDQVDIVILVFMIGRPTLNRRPLLI